MNMAHIQMMELLLVIFCHSYFLTEFLEHKALDEAPLKPSMFLRYVDDTFLVWSHGYDALTEYFKFMNNSAPKHEFFNGT